MNELQIAAEALEKAENTPELAQAIEYYFEGFDTILNAIEDGESGLAYQNKLKIYSSELMKRSYLLLNSKESLQDDIEPHWEIYNYLRANDLFSNKKAQITHIELLCKKLDSDYTSKHINSAIYSEYAYVAPIFGKPSQEAQGKERPIPQKPKRNKIKIELSETENVNSGSINLKGGTLSLGINATPTTSTVSIKRKPTQHS